MRWIVGGPDHKMEASFVKPEFRSPRQRRLLRPSSRVVRGGEHRLLRSAWVPGSLLVVLIGVASDVMVVAIIGATIFVSGWLAQLWSRLALERLDLVHRLSQTHAFIGESVDYEIRVVNRKLLPLPWLEVHTEIAEALEPTPRRLKPSGMPKIAWLSRTTNLRWYERVTWRYRIPLTVRGLFQLGPTRLRAGDLFGLFHRERTVPDTLSLWVYPEVFPLDELGIPLYRPHGERGGGNPIFEDATRLQALRDYLPGDPRKRIDWKATARRLKLQSRIFDPSSTLHVVLALNVTTMAEAWHGFAGDLFERAVSATASLAAGYGETRVPFGLLVNCTVPNQDATVRIPPGRASAQYTRVLEALAMVDSFTLVPVERLLEEEARRLPWGSTLVLVTASLSDDLPATVARLRRRGHRTAIVYVGPDTPPESVGGAPVHNIAPAFERIAWRRSASGHTWSRVDAPAADRSDGDQDTVLPRPAPTDRPGVAAGSPWSRPGIASTPRDGDGVSPS